MTDPTLLLSPEERERRRRLEALQRMISAPSDATSVRRPGPPQMTVPTISGLPSGTPMPEDEDPTLLDRALSIGRTALDFTPVGDVMAGGRAGRDVARGDFGSAAFELATALPIVGAVGDALRPAKKAGDLKALKQLLKTGDDASSGTRLAFDMADLRGVPDVPQVPITTRPIPARGVPKDVTQAVRRNRGEFEDAVKRGMDNGGLEWYNLSPIRRGFIEELGEEAGEREFARFTQHLAATSPRSTVSQNIRRASAFSLLNRHGVEVPENQALLSELGPTLGHLSHRTAHIPSVRDIERYGTLASSDEVLLGRPKTASFGENLRGNYEPVTVDAHNLAAWGLPGGRANAAYDVLEREQKDIAAKLGIRPAQVQSSAWIGAADETGVADARPFVTVFEDVVEKAAKRQGISRDEAFRRFLRGTGALGVAGMAGSRAMDRRDDGT